MKTKSLFKSHEKITLESYLEKCGVSDIEEFLNPSGKYLEDSVIYNNIEKAVEIIYNAQKNNKKIGILIDIDMDGMASASILYKTLKHISSNSSITPFFHSCKSHGLSDKRVMKRIFSKGIELMLIPDAGSGDYEYHKTLNSHGVKCICLDHHPVSEYSKDAIVVNNQLSQNITNKSGSGCLVTFKLCQLLDKEFSKDLIDVVWFSLISDIMSMNSMENRVFAYYAKENINNKLLSKLVEKYVYSKNKSLNNTTIAWNIQPKLSSIIRSTNERLKYILFMALATEEEICIDEVMNNCDKIHNYQRKIITEEYEKRFRNKVNTDLNIIFESVEGLYSYYTGLVASRLVSEHHKPVILYRSGRDEYTASVRSPYPIKDDLNKCEYINWTGGHDSAHGIGFYGYNIENIREFCRQYQGDDSIPVIGSYNTKFFKDKMDLFYLSTTNEDLWGKDIEEPIYHIKPFKIYNTDIQIMGKNKTTIKINHDGIDFMMFFCGQDIKERLMLNEDKMKIEFECTGTLGLNEWNGKISKQIMVKEFEVTIGTKQLTIDDIF